MTRSEDQGPSTMEITVLWDAIMYIDDPEVRETISTALQNDPCDDARVLAALIGAVQGDQSAVTTLAETAAGLSGRLGETGSPWSAFVQYGLRSLPEAVREPIVTAVLPRIREDVMAQTRQWVEDQKSVDIESVRRVVEDNIPAVNEAGVAAMAAVANEPELTERGSDEMRRIQSLINEYNELWAQFRAYTPSGKNPDKRAKRLLKIEATLNAYWKSYPSLMWGQLTAQGRFLSGGASGVVGWYRVQERFDEAVAHVCSEFADVELSRLRQQSHPAAFEVLFNNGLGSFLDSGNPDHIPLGVAILDSIEADLRPLESGGALYQAACLLARDGQVDRALDYVQRALHAGESIWCMARDSDLASVHHTPRFQKLIEQG